VFQCIKYNFNSQDPTYNTLLAFAQHEDATLCEILNALKRMGRLDVINMTFNLMSGIVILNIIIPAYILSLLEINISYLYIMYGEHTNTHTLM
jgi:hypothetical protein